MFHKTLAKYYITWFNNCHDSAIYCINHDMPEKAQQYLKDAEKYLTIIMENWDAINFFSIGDNAFKIDSALPLEFRGIE